MFNARSFLVALATGAMLAGAASAQTYPSKPVRLIVPFGAGGPTDIVARLLAPKLAEGLGQSVVVDNRPGAGGNIAMAAAAKSPADGYTLLVAGSSFPINAALFPNAGYDPIKDFVPIGNVAAAPMIVVAHPATPVRAIGEIGRFARAGGANRVIVGSPGLGTVPHLLLEMLARADGFAVDLVHYKSGAQTSLSVVAGEVPLAMGATSSYTSLVRSGKVVPIAVTSSRRLTVLPDVPTMAEAGMPTLQSEAIVGALLAPAGTPPEVMAVLVREVMKAASAPDLRERLRAFGTEGEPSGPEAFAKELRSEVERWSKVIREASIKPN